MRTTRPATAVLTAVLIVALALGATACTSDDEPKAMSKADFLESADAICKKGSTAVDKASDEVDQDDEAAVEAFVTTASEKTLEQIAAVRELGFPADDADDLEAAFSAYERMFEALAEDPSKISEGATPGAKEAQVTLEAYGFEECGV